MALASHPLTMLSGRVYVLGLLTVLVLTPLLFLQDREEGLTRRFAVAITINHAILPPFYALFPVRPPGLMETSGAETLLYATPPLGELVTGMDPLDNCFPSGHVSLVLTPLLLIRGREDYRAYRTMSLLILMGIIFSIPHLGIHWVVDIVAGALLGRFACWCAQNRKMEGVISSDLRGSRPR